MAEATDKDRITLNVVVEGDEPYTKAFVITVVLQDRFINVLELIQKAYWERQRISIYGLTLHKANLPFEQFQNAKLSDETLLLLNKRVASMWPSKLDVDDDLIHIIVRYTSRHVTDTPRAIAPPSPQTEFEQLIQKFKTDRSNFVDYIRNEDASSSANAAMPKNFLQQQLNKDYINIGRPANRTWLPIVLYHEVFGQFLRGLKSSIPHSEVYRHIEQHLTVLQAMYTSENNDPEAKDNQTRATLGSLLGDGLLKITASGVAADGVIPGSHHAYLVIMEMKNEIGMGSSDPSVQAAQSYTRYWCDKMSEHWLNWCCCPSILIGIAGPWMCVLGAIFLDRPVVQPLTDFLWVGKDPCRPDELCRLARIFHCINQARIQLDHYYRTHHPPSPGKHIASPFPYLTQYSDSAGQVVHFAYRKSLCPAHPENPIFLAETSDPEDPRPIVVKFVRKYNADAHKLLAESGLAPQLLYDGTMYPDDQPGPDHAMIVMDFVQGKVLNWFGSSQLPRSVYNDIETAIKLLHSRDLVFGDLRKPNVMVLQDSMEETTGKAMLVDFDWCGKHMEGRYPDKMNMELGWHRDVQPKAVMNKEHDIHMLTKLADTNRFLL